MDRLIENDNDTRIILIKKINEIVDYINKIEEIDIKEKIDKTFKMKEEEHNAIMDVAKLQLKAFKEVMDK